MKKSALLAVSALSLGLVGLSTFVPVANATVGTSPVSTDATVTVTVNGMLGIGSDAEASAQSLDVVVPALGANAISKSEAKKIYTTNNTGSAATLSIKDKDNDTNLVGATEANKIKATTEVAAGKSGWGYNTDGGNTFKAVTTSDVSLKSVSDGSNSVDIYYGVSTDATQHADTYSDTVTYTLTKD